MRRPKWTELEDDAKLTALLREITEVCTVSETAQKVMTLTRAGEVNLTAVVDAVMKDPFLAAELLRLANSPLFGQARQVQDIKRAVVVVGMQELHNIAAAMSMMAAFASPNPLSEELRNTSVLAAATARLTARRLGGVDEAEAFLAGLLGEIGAMACTAVDTIQYTALWQSSQGNRDTRAKYEKMRYTANADEIAFHVLQKNRLPDEVAAAVRGVSEAGGLLGRITDFSRRAVPLIILAAETADPKYLMADVPSLAARLELPDLEPNEWAHICIQAAAVAELSLRGEMLLTDNVDLSTMSSPPADPAAFEMSEIVHAETEARRTQTQTLVLSAPESSVRLEGEKRAPAFKWVFGMLVLAAFCVAAYFLLFR